MDERLFQQSKKGRVVSLVITSVLVGLVLFVALDYQDPEGSVFFSESSRSSSKRLNNKYAVLENVPNGPATPAAAAGGKTATEIVTTTKSPAADDDEEEDEPHKDSRWVISRSRIIISIIMLVLAVVAPFGVYFLFRFLENKRESEMALSGDSTPTDEIRLVDQRYALARDIREQLSVPVGMAVFIQFLGMGLNFLKFPEWWNDYPVRKVINDAVAAALILVCLWTWFRIVEVVRLAVGRHSWVVRSKMFSLYDEVSFKMGLVAKCIGALLVVLLIAVLWGTADEFSSQSAIASLSVAVLGSLAFVGNIFKGTLRQYKAGLDLIEENLFRAGDEVEIYGRAWGRVRGRVAYIESRFCIVVGRDGKKIYVPTEFFPASCIINHSRGSTAVNVDVHIHYNTPVGKIQAYMQGIDAALKEHPLLQVASTKVHLKEFTPTCISLLVTAIPNTEDDVALAHEHVMLTTVQIAREHDIQFSQATPKPDLSTKSFIAQ